MGNSRSPLGAVEGDAHAQGLEERAPLGDSTPQSGLQILRDPIKIPARVPAEIKNTP